MADFHRLTWLLVLGCMLWLMGPRANAADATYTAFSETNQVCSLSGGGQSWPALNDGKCYQYRGNGTLPWANTAVGACQAFAGYVGYSYVGIEGSGPNVVCVTTYWFNGGRSDLLTQFGTFSSSTTYSCAYPDDLPSAPNVTGSLSGSTCTCPAGMGTGGTGGSHYCTDGQASICSALAGQAPNFLGCTGESCRYYATEDAPLGACAQPENSGTGCVVSGSFAVKWHDEKAGAWGVDMSGVKFTGEKCVSGQATVSPQGADVTGDGTTDRPPVTDDHVGKCPGTVNGVEVWQPCSWTKTESTKYDFSLPKEDGSKDGTQTTTTTECKDGKCTTTTSITHTNTSVTGTVTVTGTGGGSTSGSKSGYCKENPKDPACGDQGSWGGTCSQGFTCSGDAALCAAAKGVWEQKCALIDGPGQPNSEQQAYAAAKAASGSGLQTTALTVGPGNFDSSNAIGTSANCIGDMEVTVMGKALVLPFSIVCPYLEVMGTVLLAVGWLSAAAIVGKGVA